jgi:hypothetical protein
MATLTESKLILLLELAVVVPILLGIIVYGPGLMHDLLPAGSPLMGLADFIPVIVFALAYEFLSPEGKAVLSEWFTKITGKKMDNQGSASIIAILALLAVVVIAALAVAFVYYFQVNFQFDVLGYQVDVYTIAAGAVALFLGYLVIVRKMLQDILAKLQAPAAPVVASPASAAAPAGYEEKQINLGGFLYTVFRLQNFLPGTWKGTFPVGPKATPMPAYYVDIDEYLAAGCKVLKDYPQPTDLLVYGLDDKGQISLQDNDYFREGVGLVSMDGTAFEEYLKSLQEKAIRLKYSVIDAWNGLGTVQWKGVTLHTAGIYGNQYDEIILPYVMATYGSPEKFLAWVEADKAAKEKAAAEKVAAERAAQEKLIQELIDKRLIAIGK